ncbi:MAG: HEAT repeat domain-containing protein [Terriglobia bacterium]
MIFSSLMDPNGGVRDKALSNLGWILDRYRATPTGARALATIQGALKQTKDRAAQLVALRLIGGAGEGWVYVNAAAGQANPFLIFNPSIRRMLLVLLENPESSLRPQVLRLVNGSPALRADSAMPGAVAAALHDDDLSVRNEAIDLLVKMHEEWSPSLRAKYKPLFQGALESNDPNVRLQASRALGVPVPPPPPAPRLVSLTGEKVSMADVPFDFNYFTAFVEPLFVKKYGGTACIDCHTPKKNISGMFRILAPRRTGRYTLQQSRVNFISVLAVINRRKPLESKLLLKPLNPTTREGTIRGMHHDGGVFWQSQYDPDFEIVADWLKGAKLEDPPGKQLDFAYFRNYVERIFSTPGPDGFACINCHFSHAILHLESPETANGKFSIEEVVNNYQSALRVVDESAPSNSYIVRKPTSPREGVPGGLSHAGGVRWPEKKQSWQYHALITWIGMPNLAKSSEIQASAKPLRTAGSHGTPVQSR